MRMMGITRTFPLVKALNLVTTRPAADIALAAPDARGRMLTLVPWRGKAIVGTGQSPAALGAASPVTAAEIDAFVGDANHAFPALKLTAADVSLVHRGLVPAVARRDGSLDLLPNSLVLDHAAEGAAGGISAIGAKYTTARAVAERVANLAGRRLGKRLAPSRSAVSVLPYAGIADHEALAIETGRAVGVELEPVLLKHLVSRYAEGAAAIVRLIAERPETAAPLAPPAPSIAAEVVHVARHEAALRLSDVVLRRTTLGASGHPGAVALEACARVAAAEFGWDAARTAAEIAAVEQCYRLA